MKIKFVLGFAFIIILSTALFLFLRPGSENHSDAYIERVGEKSFIKLKGRRYLMAHDPISALKGETYEDSILIPIGRIKNGLIRGEDIPVEEGYYKYRGTITVDNENLIINLLADNTDDKTLEPSSWNGEYRLNYR